MAYTNQQIIDYYNSTVGAGKLDEAAFVDFANANGVSNAQLQSAQQQLLSQAPAAPPAPAAAPAAAPVNLGMTQDRFTPAQYQGAREWANGKDGQTILSVAKQIGLSSDELGKVFGQHGGTGSQVAQLTGYGTSGGINKDAGEWMYDQSSGWTKVKKPTVQGSGGSTYGDMGVSDRSANQNIFNYDQQNPYMSQMAQNIGRQINDNVQRNIMPSVRNNAQQVGGYGGSRQGVVEANVYNDANKQFTDAVTNMYYGDYDKQLTRQLDKYKTDSSYDLGIGQLALGNKTADNTYNLGLGQLQLGKDSLGQQLTIANMQNGTNRYGIDTQATTSKYNADKGYDATVASAGSAAAASMNNSNNNFALGTRAANLADDQFGFNSFMSMLSGINGINNGTTNVGNTVQQAPGTAISGINNAITPYTGFGQTQQTGGGATGAMGGALAGAQLGNLWNNSTNPYTLVNSGGFTNTPQMYITPNNSLLN